MILTYHKIGKRLELGITTVRREAFGAQLDLIREAGLAIVPASVAARMPGPGKAVAVTFDDAYQSVVTEALPEMDARGVTATVFAVAGFVGDVSRWDVRLARRPFRHASWTQMRNLAERGFEIGSHTVSHRDLTRLKRKDLRYELAVSKRMLEDHIGCGVTAVSYPFGRFSACVIEEALEAGYTQGFTSVPRVPGDPMAVGRMSVYSLDDANSMRRKLGLARGYALEYLKNRIIAGLSLGTTLVKRQT
jgi:peptidoglycan/xylan/chitin deacetylase (PgdA/CDA1 family)